METRGKRVLSVGMQASTALMMMLAALVLLFGATAQAEPGAANQALQSAKGQFQVLQPQYQVGRSYALGGNANAARPYFQAALGGANTLCNQASILQYQNRDTLNRGLYRNRNYQQLAVSLSDTLRSHCATLSSNLGALVSNPLASGPRGTVDWVLPQIGGTLSQLEQAMTLAQR